MVFFCRRCPPSGIVWAKFSTASRQTTGNINCFSSSSLLHFLNNSPSFLRYSTPGLVSTDPSTCSLILSSVVSSDCNFCSSSFRDVLLGPVPLVFHASFSFLLCSLVFRGFPGSPNNSSSTSSNPPVALSVSSHSGLAVAPSSLSLSFSSFSSLCFLLP